MKVMKRFFVIFTLLVGLFAGSMDKIEALESYDMDGDGYRTTRGAPSLTPAIALGAVALAGIIAVALINNTSSSSHVHSHS
jgi:hypothetical protein